MDQGSEASCAQCGVNLAGQVVGRSCARCLLRLALDPLPEMAPRRGTPISGIQGTTPADCFSDYELEEEIARGGMGVVYKARQISLNRTVALKMILAGSFSSPAMIARFQTEAESAARLDHPGIVPIYEINVRDGLPYFSMRLVEGGTLANAMAREKFTPIRAARLIIRVARAVHHAHQRGILHRDLKPRNILLESTGEPLVADFGLAKILDQDSSLTQSVAILGTPNYMAPEQAAGNAKQLSTAADVYSLGAILYELLTGVAPFQGATPADTLRRVLSSEPIRPRQLNSAVDRDLETLCLKCLEKDPQARLNSAESLADELERWLAHEPILARRATVLERGWKWALRSPVVAGLIVALNLVTISGVIGVLWLAIRATRAESVAKHRLVEVAAERDATELARRDAEAVASFLTEVFQSPDPVRDGHSITVAEMLGRAAIRLEDDLRGQPTRQNQLRQALGKTYIGLGLYREAIPILEKVCEADRLRMGLEHPGTLESIATLASCYSYVGRRAEALTLREQVLSLRRRVLGPEHPDTVSAMFELTRSYDDVGRREEQAKLRREALAVSRKHAGSSGTNSLVYKRFLADDMPSGQTNESIRAREEAMAFTRRRNGDEHPATLWSMLELAEEFSRAGRKDEALEVCEKVMVTSRKIHPLHHPDSLYAMYKLGQCYFETGRTNEALKLREETLSIALKVLGPEHKYSLWMMADLAASFGALRRWDDAYRLLETVVKIRRQLDGPDSPETLRAMHLLMVSCESAGRQSEVLQLCEEILSIRRKAFGEEHAETLAAKTYLANCYRHAGRLKEAIAIQEPTLESIRRLLPIDHPFRNDALRSLARCYEAAGRETERAELDEELDRIWGGHTSRPRAADPVGQSQPGARTNQFLAPSAPNGR